MLYALLIIIAVGVLLASQAGQELLSVLFWLALIAGGLYLAFWIVMIVIALLSDNNIRQSIFTVFGAIMLIAYAIWGVYAVYKKHQRGELTKQIIKKKAKDFWFENFWTQNTSKNFWKQNVNKILTIFLILAFSYLIIMLTWSFTNGFWKQ
jgi:hypothetical protein